MDKIIAGLLIACGLAVGGYFVKMGIVGNPTAVRTVSVKGLAEQEVTADRVSWSISFTAASNILSEATAKIATDRAIITKFLTDSGIPEADITLATFSVTDQVAQTYRSGAIENNRYIIQASIRVGTSQIEALTKAVLDKAVLADRGVALMDSGAPYYVYNGLNAIKPKMLADATKNALEAADSFAKEAGASLNGIQSATQGFFGIEGLDPSLADSEQPRKKVRVVATFNYYLK
jgi:uncharacterized protein